MLHAEKDVLTSYLYKARNDIKRLDLDNLQNFLNTLSTQAALLCGFSFAVLSTDNTDAPDGMEFPVFCLQVFTTVTVGAEMYVVCNGMLTTILGPTLALNGPKGSMEKAVFLMRKHRGNIFLMFTVGMVGFYFMCLFLFFLKMKLGQAIVCSIIGTAFFIYSTFMAIQMWKEFQFEEPEYAEKVHVGSDENPLTAKMNNKHNEQVSAREFLGIDDPNAGKFGGQDETSRALLSLSGNDPSYDKKLLSDNLGMFFINGGSLLKQGEWNKSWALRFFVWQIQGLEPSIAYFENESTFAQKKKERGRLYLTADSTAVLRQPSKSGKHAGNMKLDISCHGIKGEDRTFHLMFDSEAAALGWKTAIEHIAAVLSTVSE
jgi:hypothetical protein